MRTLPCWPCTMLGITVGFSLGSGVSIFVTVYLRRLLVRLLFFFVRTDMFTPTCFGLCQCLILPVLSSKFACRKQLAASAPNPPEKGRCQAQISSCEAKNLGKEQSPGQSVRVGVIRKRLRVGLFTSRSDSENWGGDRDEECQYLRYRSTLQFSHGEGGLVGNTRGI
ncbi:hypothetical protein EDB87DRAFT_463476 [Lactarius vividus]|nr:hypothetical protein EDB87DRAFT_463476 [Lactarius vividus]